MSYQPALDIVVHNYCLIIGGDAAHYRLQPVEIYYYRRRRERPAANRRLPACFPAVIIENRPRH